jgi:vacuolar-type H+-ATPase catalytic subunit A/Vma1
LSLGAAVVYAGSTYSVSQSFAPDTGAEISDSSENTTSKLLPGFYADASLQFDLTERAGFYAGAVLQSTGAYTQNVNTTAAQYSSRIDLANQSGMRGGMTIRF